MLWELVVENGEALSNMKYWKCLLKQVVKFNRQPVNFDDRPFVKKSVKPLKIINITRLARRMTVTVIIQSKLGK